MVATLRLSPSGPYLNNGGGGGFAPGNGAVLRSSAAQAPAFPSSAAANIPTGGGSEASQVVCLDGVGTGGFAVTPELSLPNRDLNYKVSAVIDVNSATNTSQVVTMYLDFSNDGGASWDTCCTNAHTVSPDASRQCQLDLPLRTGAELNVTTGDPSLIFRLRVSTPAPGGSGTVRVDNPADASGFQHGTIFMEVTETF